LHKLNNEGIKNNNKHFVNPFENNIFAIEMNEGEAGNTASFFIR
jgi:hypothetical protein